MRFRKRVSIYVTTWLMIAAGAAGIRLRLYNASTADRFPLLVGYLLSVALLLAVAGVYESRRMIVVSGWRGRGVFGCLRGWLKTLSPDFAADTPHVDSNSEREYRTFRRVSAALLLLSIPVVAALAF